MREDFLHFIWKNKKFDTSNLKTVSGEHLNILSLGQHNHLAGPDFFNAQIEVGGQLWAGNVEIHLKSSDWYAHNHEKDANYDNVVLHVVWEDDIEVYRKDGSAIPSLALKKLVAKELVNGHKSLMQSKKFINCEKDFVSVDDFSLDNWLERLFVERLEQKSTLIFQLLEDSKNDWEKVLFCLLMKNFGLNTNGAIFLEIAKSIDFTVFRKVKHDVIKSESLLMGMTNLLNEDSVDAYQEGLKQEFKFLSSKFKLNNALLPKPNFYGLRPNNFPTVRLSQLANVYAKNENLFQKLMQTNLEETKSAFEVSASEYWNTHFVFGKTSAKRKKKVTSSFIELLHINTVIPLKFCYEKKRGKSFEESLFEFAKALKPETNSIIKNFGLLGSETKNAFQSQAKLQLYNRYCVKNRCLKCAVGNELLLRNG